MSTTMRPVRLLAVVVAIVLVLGTATGRAAAQQSTSYSMDRVTLAAAAGSVTSASATMEPTFAQEGPVGSLSRCNNGFLQSTGFWSILGETPVPVHLQVRFDDMDPLGVELEWTGSASQFLIHRSTDASVITDPSNELGTTSSCTTTDSPSPTEPIIYYLVLPTGS